MAVMPAVFGTAGAVLLFVPKLAVATVMKFADNGFQYSIHETTLQALYVPFAADAKARTRALLEAMVKPLSYGLGGLLLVVLAPRLAVGDLSLVTVPLAIAWAATIPAVRRRYLRRLEATLSARGALALDHETILDAAGRRALVRVLDRGDPPQILLALEQLADDRSGDITRAVRRLAGHPDPAVRAAALARLAAGGASGDDAALARVALADPVPAVRAAAAGATAALARDEAIDDLAPLLTDPAPDVRIAAVAGLLRHGGVEGGIVGGAELGRLLSGSRDDLVTAARALHSLGTGAYRPLKRLLADPDPGVRRAALAAAPGVADPRLVPLLLDLLADRASRRRAGNALIAVGPPAVEPLGEALDRPDVSRGVKLEIPRLLKRIAVPASYDTLRRHVGATDSHLRLRIYAGMSSLRRQLGRPGEPVAFIQPLVRREIVETYRNQLAWGRARPAFAEGSVLLDEEFAFRRQRAVRRLLRLLELRADRDALRLVRERLFDPARRVNALEVLDTLLDTPLRPLVMAFVDELPDAERQRIAADMVRDIPAPEDFLREACGHPNPYVAALALDALLRARAPAALEAAARLRDHADPLVREVASRAGGAGPKEDAMYSTLEKVLLLKRAPIFEKVSGEDLAPLARVAETAVYAPGEALFAEGEMGEALLIVVRGSVAVSRGGHRVATLGPGEVLGEMSVLDRRPRSAGAQALEETEAMWIGN
jgi:HEAT repeat protein